MWPFKKGWTEKQKKFRRMCREEEKEVERMINWMEMNVENVKNAKKAREARLGALLGAVATPVPTDPDQGSVAPFEGLPDEFSGNADPIGDACCYEPKCPCHGSDE